MYKYLIILFFLTFSSSLWCQQPYTGVVFDVGSQQPISYAEVQSSNTHKWTQTSLDGSFYLPTQSQGDTQEKYFFVTNNYFYWNFKEPKTIYLFNTKGTQVFAQKIIEKGYLLLPRIQSGYYYLSVQGKESIVLSLFSDGMDYFSVRQSSLSGPVIGVDSSLLFLRNGYYDREVSLNPNHSKLSVGLLKKEYNTLDYFSELIQSEAFDMLKTSPSVTNYGEVESIKILYDFAKDKIYYFNVKRHPNHYWFAVNMLGYMGSGSDFFHSQYQNVSERFLYTASLDYHKSIDKYVLNFVAFDQIDCEGITAFYDKILATSYLKDKLFLYANKSEWEACSDVPIITSEELFLGQNFQALNFAENYGFLRKVEVEKLKDVYLGRHDIVLLDDVPNDVPVVAGIITTEFQTPLSHINILSHNRHTPNMALKDAWSNPRIDSLLGELVLLKVEADSFALRKASLEEAMNFWAEKEPQDSIVLEVDTLTEGLIQMQNADVTFVKMIGGKAANFAELVNMGSIPLPENYFAIPFYYYNQHLKNNGIDSVINNMLADTLFIENIEYRESQLKALRKLIKKAPIDTVLLDLVNAKINNFESFPSFRFRSSTNAEDLENFSGAGLYSSYSAKKDNPTKTVERAIKKVWASLWKFRAFEERSYYKINQKSIAMGVMVHRSFPDEDANGVVVTKNLYNVNHAFTINVQYKEYSIVYPEPGILQDQLLTYTTSLNTNKFTIEYLSHSNVPELEGKPVMTDEEIYELATYCQLIKDHYFSLPHNCNCSYEDFAVDLEFKVDSTVSPRKVYIKQARLYSE